MFKKLIPCFKLESVYEITPELLKKKNIKLLMLDLDNTLAPYREAKPSQRLLAWKEEIISSGIKMIIVSNTKSSRAKNFSGLLGIPYVDHARKPITKTVFEVIERMSIKPQEAALAGDQIFTDVWCANRAGVLSIIVKPLELKNVFFILRYAFEYVFRLFAPNS